MSRNPAIVTAIIVCVLTMSTVSAMAQSPAEEGGWVITPMVGLALDEDADPSLTIAGALAHRVARGIVVEGELGHVFDMAPDDADVDSSLTTVHGSVLYFFDLGYTLTPYAAGGMGIAKFSHQVAMPPDSIDRTEIGFNIGGGVTIPLNDRTSARGDVRFMRHIDDVPSVWRFGAAITIRLP